MSQEQYAQQGLEPTPGGGSYPPPGPPQRKRRHPVRIIAGAVGALVVVLVSVAAAHGSPAHTVTGTGSPASIAATEPASAAVQHNAGIGSAIVLTGDSNAEQMTVTVTRVWTHAQPATQFDAPDPGDVLYAVQFRLADSGSAAYSDSPSNGAVVVDSAGQSYQSSFDNAAECDPFAASENIAPGSTGLGCIVFEVPVNAKITTVQFTLDSGMGPQTGQWDTSLKG